MFLSLFDVFKMSIGPSSSHTMGPMIAASRFLGDLPKTHGTHPLHIQCTLYGSLALTGKGHATDKAVSLGLLGYLPETINPDTIDPALQKLAIDKALSYPGFEKITYDPTHDLIFNYGPPLAGHPNGMIFKALNNTGHPVFEQTYYSTGGGWVSLDEELIRKKETPRSQAKQQSPEQNIPYPFANSEQMLALGIQHNKSIAQMQYANECAVRSDTLVRQGIDHIWHAMNACIDRGLRLDGILPGGLDVQRRAKKIYDRLRAQQTNDITQPHIANDWMAVYAMAVNEENAAGGKVVTAPTNGAAGVLPAVLRYYLVHCANADPSHIHRFLLTSTAIGTLIKNNASISGAEVGCQGEVGAASSMAAAGFCAALGGTNHQVENAAEIALEHHLGMTCDPVSGLVQVPCIERNSLGAIKAVSAASIALHGDGTHFMPLDNCIEAMRQTGIAMSEKFKETGLGGLAVNLPAC